ncbi:hypothetical protein [Kitasatospora kifunensis]|uniref:Type IV secretory pathway VirB10-like protein n=1 Tax=Kitasatospora kifunensis TaxID=58351 RepID=A0A7W7R414_KITKI|nr:hypothetical protein [Kitasatospora kifunensis]MBB4924939.1 type IV secretory pathway VirB10-like protein [Kitasatospora kifunensis]
MAAARAAVVVVTTWLALLVLMMLLGSLLPGPRPQGTYSSTAIMLWLLALLLGPLVTCVALRRWIAVGRAGSPEEPLPPGPYARAEQDTLQSGGHTWRADASPPPQPDEERTFRAPRAPEDPDAEARRRAHAEAERKRAEAERAREKAERERKEEARRRAARNRRLREGRRRY